MARILTYNVRRCLGTDGVLSPSRIASVIAATRADIVALQELDVRRARSDGIDQAHQIAHQLGMRHVFFNAAMRVFEEEYGDAILTTCPSRLIKAGGLPARWRFSEPRGALWVAVQIDDVALQVVTTHLGLSRSERLLQTDTLLGPDWLAHPDCREPVVFLGDFNSLPRGRVYRRINALMQDAQAALPEGRRPRPSFPSRFPLFRIDHVFAGCHIEVKHAETINAPPANVASDHLPLLVDLNLTAGANGDPKW